MRERITPSRREHRCQHEARASGAELFRKFLQQPNRIYLLVSRMLWQWVRCSETFGSLQCVFRILLKGSSGAGYREHLHKHARCQTTGYRNKNGAIRMRSETESHTLGSFPDQEELHIQKNATYSFRNIASCNITLFPSKQLPLNLLH